MKKVYTEPLFMIEVLTEEDILTESVGEYSTDFNGNGNWFDDDGGFDL